MYTIGNSSNLVGQTPLTNASLIADVQGTYDWSISIVNRTGGSVIPDGERYYIGYSSTITKINCMVGRGGSTTGKVSLASIDFPIDSFSQVVLYYKNEPVYRGFVDGTPDPKGGDLKLNSYIKKLKDVRYNGSFTAKTPKYILESVLNSVDDKTGIYYNGSITDLDSTNTYSLTWEYETIEKIVSDIVELDDGKYYGVDPHGFFFVTEDKTDIDYYIFNSGERSAYVSMKVTENAGRIKMTRAQIYQKTASGETTRIGEVGYGSGYATIVSLENQVGVIEGKETVPVGLTATESKDLIYGRITGQRAGQNIKIKSLDYSRFPVKVGDRVKIWDNENKQLYEIVDCDSLTGWSSGATLDTSLLVAGTGSIQIDTKQGTFYYDFLERMIVSHGTIKIGMMLYSDTIGNALSITVGSEMTGYSVDTYSVNKYSQDTFTSGRTFETINNVYLKTVNAWEYYEFEIAGDFRYIKFGRQIGGSGAVINIDRIQLFDVFQQNYVGNVNKISYNLSSNNLDLVDIELGDYEEKYSERTLELEKKVEILEATNSN